MHHSEKITEQLLLVTDLQAVSHISAIKLFKWNNYTRWFFKYLAFLWLMIQITPSSLMLSFVLCFWLLPDETFTSYWRSHSSQTVFVFWKWVLTLPSPRYQCNEINDRNSLGKFFSCWFWNWHFTQFFFFFFLICRTSLRLGENRGPSIWDVLCWVSLLPQFMLSQNVSLSLHNFREWMKYLTLLQSRFQVLPPGGWEGRDSGHLLHWFCAP